MTRALTKEGGSRDEHLETFLIRLRMFGQTFSPLRRGEVPSFRVLVARSDTWTNHRAATCSYPPKNR